MPAFVVALFLAAHAAIHLSFVSPRPPATAGGPAWPFELERSWLLTPLGLDPVAARAIGLVLLAVLVVAFAAAALSVVGVMPPAAFQPALIVGGVASIVMLALFFSPWLVLGFVINAVLIWAAAGGWRPGAVGT